MKNKNLLLLFSPLLGAFLFSFLFWKENVAINLFIYSLFLIACNLLNSAIDKNFQFYLYTVLHLAAAVLVVVNNTDLSIITYWLSLMIFTGYAHYPKIRSVFYALLAAFIQIVKVPLSIFRLLSEIKISKTKPFKHFSKIKYVVLPFIIVFLFAITYGMANDIFANYLTIIAEKINKMMILALQFIFRDISFGRIMHFIFGLALTGGLLITLGDRNLETYEQKYNEHLLRIRRPSRQKNAWTEFFSIFMGNYASKMMALKTEYIVALISLAALNLLLLLLNFVDLSTLWFGTKPSGNFSGDLHNGTNALIFSIVMAMTVIVYFFSSNLNFYTKSKTLRTLAYIWIVQNLFLVCSMLLRDAYYIGYHGLTFKRIGIIVFGCLCVIGLITVYIKVNKQKTLYYLFKVNGQIWFLLLLLNSLINWEVFIVRYNISHRDSIAFDAGYLLSLSDRVLPELHQNRSAIEQTILKQGGNAEHAALWKERLDNRIENFTDRLSTVSWLSWNLPDARAADYFSSNPGEDPGYKR